MAPMAGITNLPFRLLIREFGCDLAFTEMVSAMGLVRGTVKSYRYLDTAPEDRPLGVQLFGADPDVMAEAARIVAADGAALIDINMGCPVKKVVRTGSGAALMKEPGRIAAILRAVRQAITIPLTVKIRSGWNRSTVNAPDIAAIAEDCGVDAVIVHGRTAEQGYAGQADWKIIGAVKSRVRVPVVGNGDLRSGEDALRMRDASGCDAFMVGRGALGSPWIFREIIAALDGADTVAAPSLPERRAIIEDHMNRELAYAGEKIGYRSFRKHLLWYTRGLRGGARFRHAAAALTSPDQMWETFDLLLADEGMSLK